MKNLYNSATLTTLPANIPHPGFDPFRAAKERRAAAAGKSVYQLIAEAADAARAK